MPLILITDTIFLKADSTKHWESPGQVLLIFLPLELHNYPHGTLEEVTLELQPNFPMLVGSKNINFSFWTAGYKRDFLCQVLVALDPRTALGFKNLLSKRASYSYCLDPNRALPVRLIIYVSAE